MVGVYGAGNKGLKKKIKYLFKVKVSNLYIKSKILNKQKY